MAIAFESNLKSSISRGEILPVYILFGDDAYLKKNYSEKILKKITDKDDVFNYAHFEESADLQEVYDAVMQFPFASDKKYVELVDFNFEKASKTDYEMLLELIAEVPDTAAFVLRFDAVECDVKNGKFTKLCDAVTKKGGLAVNLGHRSVPELCKMLMDGARKRGKKMDSSVAKYLIETAGEDINMLSHELTKLCAYCESTITKADVDLVAVKTVESSVFDLSKTIFSGNLSLALSMLDELLFMRVEPYVILYTVSSSYIDLLRVFSAMSEGVSIAEVKEKFAYGKKGFLLDKAQNYIKKFDIIKLRLSFEALVNADKSLKSYGVNERIVLEELIVRLVYIILKGEALDKD